MRKPFWLLGVAALMATLVSCNRNAKPEPAVYELEVYKTQKIVLNAEDRDLESEYSTDGAVNITLKGNDISASSDVVAISNNKVIISGGGQAGNIYTFGNEVYVNNASEIFNNKNPTFSHFYIDF